MATGGDQVDGTPEPLPRTAIATPSRFVEVVPGGSTIGIGSLPHRDADAAAQFSLDAFDVLTLPTLPQRSPSEAPIAQALGGAPGITMGQYRSISVDVARLDPSAPVRTELWRDEFTGMRTALEHARAAGHRGPVKWQFAGPISLGVTLRRAGAPSDVAFAVSARIVSSHLRDMIRHVRAALPESPQLVMLDEPLLDGVLAHDFPIAPDETVDLLSSTMAAVCRDAAVGIHTCGDIDLATLLATGPDVVSVPVRPAVSGSAGYVGRFLGHGGMMMWGAVTTEGPIATTPARSERRLRTLWGDLVDRGCDPDLVRSQSLISPQCGLGGHSVAVAERVCDIVGEVAAAVS